MPPFRSDVPSPKVKTGVFSGSGILVDNFFLGLKNEEKGLWCFRRGGSSISESLSEPQLRAGRKERKRQADRRNDDVGLLILESRIYIPASEMEGALRLVVSLASLALSGRR